MDNFFIQSKRNRERKNQVKHLPLMVNKKRKRILTKRGINCNWTIEDVWKILN
jgi:hypothetical protein